MQAIKELTGLIGLIIVMLVLIGHLNNTFATKLAQGESSKLIQENKKEIKIIKTKSRNNGSILCGMAIDLKLPTAKKACKDAISNN